MVVPSPDLSRSFHLWIRLGLQTGIQSQDCLKGSIHGIIKGFLRGFCEGELATGLRGHWVPPILH
jgi:hypothetical protein